MSRFSARIASASLLIPLFLVLLFCNGHWAGYAQEQAPSRLILRADETVGGPYAGEKSLSCLKVYSDGSITYARRWNSAMSVVNAAGQASRPEHTVFVSHHIEAYVIDELTELFESRPFKRLAASFAPPHQPVDYFESILIQITDPSGKTKQISTREYYVASLKEKTRYPAALILLMDKIDEIETAATDKGVPTDAPRDCQLNLKNH